MLAEGVAVVSSFVFGFSVYYYIVVGKARGWGWLRTWGDRLAFFIWPYPPRVAVEVLYPSGRKEIHYDVEYERGEDGRVVFRLPHMHLTLHGAQSERRGLTYDSGTPESPLVLMLAGLGGLSTFLFVLYSLFAFALGYGNAAIPIAGTWIYLYLWYNAARTSYYPLYKALIVGYSGDSATALPSPETVGPRVFFQLARNNPVVIRVHREARAALEETARLVGGDKSAAAEVLATSTGYVTMRRALTAMQHRLAEARLAERNLLVMTGEYMLRPTIARALAFLAVFLLGVALGWMLGGGGISISPAG